MSEYFTICSTELRDYKVKHKCRRVGTVDGDKLLIELQPPIPGHVYSLRNDIEKMVIAPRHKGAVLVPEISEWPCRVHMCLPAEGGTWEKGPFKILDWGVIE